MANAMGVWFSEHVHSTALIVGVVAGLINYLRFRPERKGMLERLLLRIRLHRAKPPVQVAVPVKVAPERVRIPLRIGR